VIIEKMARDLGLTPRFVESLARSASHEYKVYSIKKKTGGLRQIHHPSKKLKALQRWLLANVVEKLPIHAAAVAYRQGRSIFDNASIHAPRRYLLRMDLTDFFPSITETDVRKYLSERAALLIGWTSSDTDVFCRLVCRYGALTIGSPTSPALSNAICYDLDVSLHALSAKSGVTYTRYADDLFFSCDQKGVLRQLEVEVNRIVATLGVPTRLRINASKTRHASRRTTRRVTGIVLGSDGRPSIGRSLKRKIRALVHKFESLDQPARSSLAGMIAYATGFDPQFKNSLIDKYGLKAVRKAAVMHKLTPSPPTARTKTNRHP
jgi:RNA-directed DNA polymerase